MISAPKSPIHPPEPKMTKAEPESEPRFKLTLEPDPPANEAELIHHEFRI